MKNCRVNSQSKCNFLLLLWHLLWAFTLGIHLRITFSTKVTQGLQNLL